MKPVQINNINIFPFSSRVELINYAFEHKKSLIAINAEKILHATDQIRELVNKNIGYADGLGAILVLKKKGFKNVVKIPGVELWLDVVRHFYKSKSFYLVGAKEEVIQEAVEKLKSEFKGINLLGYRNGYIKTEAEKQQLIQTIVTLKPDIVFVALGSPKQELLMQEMQQYHTAIYQGLGGSFDVYVGKVKRAPTIWVNLGLEWAYRWLKEPRVRTRRNLQLFRFFFKFFINQL